MHWFHLCYDPTQRHAWLGVCSIVRVWRPQRLPPSHSGHPPDSRGTGATAVTASYTTPSHSQGVRRRRLQVPSNSVMLQGGGWGQAVNDGGVRHGA